MTIHVPYTRLLDLACDHVGGSALSCSDDFFASKENLLKREPAVFLSEKFTDRGKWMDGWESRRKRGVDAESHDWCVLKLGIPGSLHGLDIDTSFFVGNFPECVAVDAAECAEPDAKGAQWREVVPLTPLQGGSHNLLAVADRRRYTHLRLRIYPDGGVARLRAYGEACPDWKTLLSGAGSGELDVACASHGGEVVAASDHFFGPKDNLILPGKAVTMGDGWETRRRRGPGHDWIVVRLGASARLSRVEIDTAHFKGNFPHEAALEVLAHPSRTLTARELRDRTDLSWVELLPRTRLTADRIHSFDKELGKAAKALHCDYLRLLVYPDGGVSRLRAFAGPDGIAPPKASG